MIGWIQGRLLELHDNRLLLDVGGVGYELDVTASALGRLPAVGESLQLFTHLVVREDAQLLYGFGSRDERDLFRFLVRINGVGPKLALALLSSLTLSELAGAVQQQDVSTLSKVPGIGRKTAERLTIELKDRLSQVAFVESSPHAPVQRGGVRREAEDALLALGYKPAESRPALDAAAAEGLDTGEWVRRALQHIARQAEVAN